MKKTRIAFLSLCATSTLLFTACGTADEAGEATPTATTTDPAAAGATAETSVQAYEQYAQEFRLAKLALGPEATPEGYLFEDVYKLGQGIPEAPDTVFDPATCQPLLVSTASLLLEAIEDKNQRFTSFYIAEDESVGGLAWITLTADPVDLADVDCSTVTASNSSEGYESTIRAEVQPLEVALDGASGSGFRSQTLEATVNGETTDLRESAETALIIHTIVDGVGVFAVGNDAFGEDALAALVNKQIAKIKAEGAVQGDVGGADERSAEGSSE